MVFLKELTASDPGVIVPDYTNYQEVCISVRENSKLIRHYTGSPGQYFSKIGTRFSRGLQNGT